ncbi:MAG: hypothetical protein L3V56_06650, partial [Candidatus Magnetoovum sp. WYHC-5]|nr:hypothetical protein [Candidatus Magnetoovum sp. WYHC-5]
MTKHTTKRTLLSALVVSISLLVALVVVELVFRVFPSLLPDWYKADMPAHGVELFNPGIFKKTPIDGVPLPLITSPLYTGKTEVTELPKDLEDLHMVDGTQNPDKGRVTDLLLPLDEYGFANENRLESADVLLVGDSFTFALGVKRPIGFLEDFSKQTGLTVYNLGVSGVGPLQEEWLLNNIGLNMKPALVLWFIFPLNDLSDAYETYNYMQSGIDTYAKLYADKKMPSIHTLSLMKKLFISKGAGEGDKQKHTYLKGLQYNSINGEMPVWFHPNYLRLLSRGVDEWSRAN